MKKKAEQTNTKYNHIKKEKANVYYLIKDNKVIDHYIDTMYDVNNIKQREIYDRNLMNWFQKYHNDIPLLLRKSTEEWIYVDFNLIPYTDQEQSKLLNNKYKIAGKHWDKTLQHFEFDVVCVNIGLSDCSYWASKDYMNAYRISWSANGYLNTKLEYKDLFSEVKEYDANCLGEFANERN